MKNKNNIFEKHIIDFFKNELTKNQRIRRKFIIFLIENDNDISKNLLELDHYIPLKQSLSTGDVKSEEKRIIKLEKDFIDDIKIIKKEEI